MLWAVQTETVGGGLQSTNKQKEKNKRSMPVLLLGGAVQCWPEDKFD